MESSFREQEHLLGQEKTRHPFFEVDLALVENDEPANGARQPDNSSQNSMNPGRLFVGRQNRRALFTRCNSSATTNGTQRARSR